MVKYLNNKIYNADEESFRDIIAKSVNVTDALRKLGYLNPRAGRSRATLMNRIDELSIDISHFDEKNKRFPINAMSIKEMFAKNTNRNNQHLKTIIKRHNLIDYKCECCGNEGKWMGTELSLHLDHINGEHSDNTIENLRFLCPNCHSQTDTYAGKNK